MAEAPQTNPAGAPQGDASPDKPEKEAKTVGDTLEWLFVWFIVIALFFKAWSTFTAVGPNIGGSIQASYAERVAPYANGMVHAFTIFASILCLFFFIGTIYATIRGDEVAAEWLKKINPVPPEDVPADEKVKNSRWQLVVNHISSDNPSDWRLAILESDIILADLFDSLGYQGDTVGDKLRSAEKAPFRTLTAAWEGHRIRNAIAHEGQDFTLTEREAKRVVGLYESVFREFDYI